MVKFRHSSSQIWEVIIISTIVLVIVYRFALVYDFIPERFWPSTIFNKGYTSFKTLLKEEEKSPSALGQTAHYILEKLNSTEKYIREQREAYERADAAAQRCGENLLFRYFMFMGDEQNTSCSERDLKLKEALKEISGPTVQPTAPVQQPQNVAPAKPQPSTNQPVETPINTEGATLITPRQNP